jgi:hypothetical protein
MAVLVTAVVQHQQAVGRGQYLVGMSLAKRGYMVKMSQLAAPH